MHAEGRALSSIEEERKARWFTSNGGIGLTHPGVVEIERSHGSPEEPTEHFLPSVFIRDVINSQIHVGKGVRG